MSFEIPIPQAIQQRLEAELNLSLDTQNASLAQTPENMIARVTTIASYELYGYIRNMSKQILPDYADEEYLLRHANLWLRRGYKDAGFASGDVVITGSDGKTIPADVIIQLNENVSFELQADVTIGIEGEAIGQVLANGAGISGNLSAGVTLSLQQPLGDVDSIVVGTGGLSGGTEQETIEEIRSRVLERIKTPPQGGAKHDYIAWSKEVEGVTRAWPYPLQQGLGTVSIIFVMDGKEGSIIPSAAELQAVEDHLNTVRPTTAQINVIAPIETPINFNIAISPNDVATQAAILAELKDFFAREAVPSGTLRLSRIREAISFAAGERFHELTSPNADIVSSYAELPTLGNITYSEAV